MKKYAILLVLLGLTATFANAQFPIKIPKIRISKVEQQKPENEPQIRSQPQSQNDHANNSISTSDNSQFGKTQARQMVMDDGYTFFGAGPVEEYDSKVSLKKDIGWYLDPKLRLMGTFPKRSAFRITVKKNGKQLTSVRCDARLIYTKSGDTNLRRPRDRERDLSFEDFMISGYDCSDKKQVNKEIGRVAIEVYFIDGDTDAESLVRTYKVDVHKATKVQGAASNPQPAVADYYIQRHAEAAVAFAYFNANGVDYHSDDPAGAKWGKRFRTLTIHTTYSPKEGSFNVRGTFARCSVNGEKIPLEFEDVSLREDGNRQEIGIYLDRLTPQYKRGSAYKDQVEFIELRFEMPFLVEESPPSTPRQLNVEKYPGKWECSVVANGQTYRTFRWEVANGKIVPHAEQKNGNVNLYYDAAMIDMEIPAGGSPLDYRLMPMPEIGLFYGIPWTTAEGKALGSRVPDVGNPYPVPSTNVK